MSTFFSGNDLKPIHIVHVVYEFEIGGMENGIVNVINASDPTRFQFSIIAMTRLGSARNRIHTSAVRFFELGKGLGNDWRVVWKLRQLLRQINPDIVYTHSWATYLEGVIAARLAGVPTVIHGEHGTTYFEKYRRILAYQCLNFWTTQYTTVSACLRQRIAEVTGIGLDRITWIPNGVDTTVFKPSPSGRQQMRTTLGFGEDEYVVGTVGRLVPVKGLDLFINSIRYLAASGIKVRGVLVGDGPLRCFLQDLSQKNHFTCPIMFFGERADVPDILQAFDVFVSTSHSEGMSNTILEAMATGLPIVATEVGETPYLVKPLENGLLAPPNNAEKIAQALASLRGLPERCVHMRRENLRRCQQEFSLTKMVDRYTDFFASMLSKP